jgi:hypothetical protein
VNDNRLAAGLALLVAVPAMVWAVRDFREGRQRLLIASRRSRVEVARADDPRRFWRYTAINAIACGVIVVFAVLLFLKPPE